MAAIEKLSYQQPVALVGGGRAAPADIDAAVERAGAVIAVDGGANHFEPGLAPRVDAVIGDMDSVADLDRWRAEPTCRVLAIAEQETTDFEKALSHVAAPFYLGVGFQGDRIDHTLAALNALARRPEQRVLLIGPEDVCFLTPLSWRATLWPGARVSIFPLPKTRAIRSEGLRWPLDGLSFAVGGATGVSNEATTTEISARFEDQGALVILERRALDAAVAALAAPST